MDMGDWKRPLHYGDVAATIPEYDIDRFLQNKVEMAGGPGFFRVLPLTTAPTSDARSSYFYESLSGYHGAKLALYQDYLDRHVADEGFNPLAQLQDQRMREALVEAIKHLPEREQYVMSMYYEHDMNLKEIAAVLKVTESRVCQLHSQSIARLRVKLRE